MVKICSYSTYIFFSPVKNEGVGVSLRPGAPPTMVSVPSVLDTLSASSLLSAEILQESESPTSSKHQQNDDELGDENPEMCTGEDFLFYRKGNIFYKCYLLFMEVATSYIILSFFLPFI